jgi:hypothetical protein
VGHSYDLSQPMLLLMLIHRSAWMEYSTTFVCRILDDPLPATPALLPQLLVAHEDEEPYSRQYKHPEEDEAAGPIGPLGLHLRQ